MNSTKKRSGSQKSLQKPDSKKKNSQSFQGQRGQGTNVTSPGRNLTAETVDNQSLRTRVTILQGKLAIHEHTLATLKSTEQQLAASEAAREDLQNKLNEFCYLA